jgi:hypothetical protein
LLEGKTLEMDTQLVVVDYKNEKRKKSLAIPFYITIIVAFVGILVLNIGFIPTLFNSNEAKSSSLKTEPISSSVWINKSSNYTFH